MLRLILITIALLMTASSSDASSNCNKQETLKLIGAGYTKDDISEMCSNDSGPSNKILGSWKDSQGEGTFEFLDDGTLLVGLTKGGKKVSGKWSILKDGRLKIEMRTMWGASKVRVQEYKFEGDQLIFMGESGETDRLDRLTDSGSAALDAATSTKRFIISDEFIRDSQTGLDWLVGADQDTDYNSAMQWVASISDTAGGGWRMPTRQELKSLYQKGVGKHNLDPVFKMSGWAVWAEPYDSSSAWNLVFRSGNDGRMNRVVSGRFRGFAVRSSKK